MRNYIIILSSSVLLLITGISLTSTTTEKVNSEKNKTALSCSPEGLTGAIDHSDTIAIFEGKEMPVSDLAMIESDQPKNVLGVAKEERWVEVDLSEQKLMAWEGDDLYLETPISSGLPGTPTPTGEFRVWIKLRATKMSGGSGAGYYYLPNVPYVMYFGNDQVPNFRGYGLHGTYWHNDFGTPRSHGCVNLPTPVAKEIYEWSSPILSKGERVVRSSSENPGMRIVIHE